MASCYSLPKGHWYVSQMPPVWYIYLQNWVILEVTFETYFIYIYGWWFEPLWKIWKSVGMMTFPIYRKIKFMFQTTKQIYIYIYNGAKGTGDNSAVTNGNSCWFPQPAPTSPYLLTPLTPGFPDRVGRVGFLHVVGGSLGLVDQVRVEDVELVAWRIDEIQMNLRSDVVHHHTRTQTEKRK